MLATQTAKPNIPLTRNLWIFGSAHLRISIPVALAAKLLGLDAYGPTAATSLIAGVFCAAIAAAAYRLTKERGAVLDAPGLFGLWQGILLYIILLPLISVCLIAVLVLGLNGPGRIVTLAWQASEWVSGSLLLAFAIAACTVVALLGLTFMLGGLVSRITAPQAAGEDGSGHSHTQIGEIFIDESNLGLAPRGDTTVAVAIYVGHLAWISTEANRANVHRRPCPFWSP
jgi:hypothetical protein